MSAYLLRRFGQGLLVLWAAFTLTFFLLQVLPGQSLQVRLLVSPVQRQRVLLHPLVSPHRPSLSC